LTFSEECTEASLHIFTFDFGSGKKFRRKIPFLPLLKSDVKEIDGPKEKPIIIASKALSVERYQAIIVEIWSLSLCFGFIDKNSLRR
jgi:hypothetical protein